MEQAGLIIQQYTEDAVDAVWFAVLPFVAEAAKWSRGEFVAQDVYDAARDGHMQIWVVTEAETANIRFVLVTELIQYPRKKVCNMYAVAGRGVQEGWDAFWPWAQAWLQQNEISEIIASGRPSIARLWRRLGFKVKYEVLGIDVKGVQL